MQPKASVENDLEQACEEPATSIPAKSGIKNLPCATAFIAARCRQYLKPGIGTGLQSGGFEGLS